jgi:PPOX class probable F420-dependent enzyme
MTPEERRAFLADNKFCIVAYARRAGPPAVTPVYYVMDGDDLIISTTRARAKAKALAARPDVTICVIDDWTPARRYLTVYGRARIEDEGAADAMYRIGSAMQGTPLPESVRPALEERAKAEQRIVLRITPAGFVG